MKRRPNEMAAGVVAIGVVAALLLVPAPRAPEPSLATTVAFTHTGSAQQFVVPPGVIALDVVLRGAGGGGNPGNPGLGGQASATIAVSPGDTLQVMVGGKGDLALGGFNGGGDPGVADGTVLPAGGGGGASDIRTGPCAATSSCPLAARVLVAGGGGGTDTSTMYPTTAGGHGGGTAGGDGNEPGFPGMSGAGGSGAGGSGAGNGANGVLGDGGTGGDSGGFGFSAGAGGGGGYYGGGGGSGATIDPAGGNGGGGSGFGPPGTVFASGVSPSGGSVSITYVVVATSTTTNIISSSVPSPSVVGQPVDFTAEVSPVPTGGTVQFRVDGFDVGAPVPLDPFGQATSDALDTLAIGTRTIEAVYSGDGVFLPSTSPGDGFTVDQAASTIALSAFPATGVLGELISYSATVGASAPGSAIATGTVAFRENGTLIEGCESVPLDGAEQAACPTSAASAGSPSISASFGGSPDLLPSSTSITVVIDPGPAPPDPPPPPTGPPPSPPIAAPSTPPSTGAPPVTSPAAGPQTTRATPAAPRTPTTLVARDGEPDRETPSTTRPTQRPITRKAVADVEFNLEVSDPLAGATAIVTGSGFEPGSTVSIVLHSTPVTLSEVTIGEDGAFSETVRFPSGVEPGVHHVDVSGRSDDGEDVTQVWYFEIDNNGIVTRLEDESSSSPPAWAEEAQNLGRPVSRDTTGAIDTEGSIPKYVITDHPEVAVATMVSGFALLAVLIGQNNPALGSGMLGTGGGAALAASSAGAVAAERRKKSRGSAKTKYKVRDSDGQATGDRSATWRMRGGEELETVVCDTTERVAPFSPLLARILNDSTYVRAMFGTLSAITPVVGLILGVIATVNTNGAAVAPAAAILIAIVLVSIVDSMAGLTASLAFVVGTLVGGGVTSPDELRSLLGIVVIFFAIPLIGAAARPLRRKPSTSLVEHFDRVADVVIASLIAAWAAKKLVGALPALSGLDLPIADRSGTVALVVLAAMALRMGAETVAMWLYPTRLTAVAPQDVPSPPDVQRLCSIALGTGFLVFFAIPYVGNGWELYAGAALFALPQVAGLYKDRLPNLSWLVRALPGGIVKTTLMMLVGTWFAAFVSSRVEDPARFITIGFVVLSIPGLVLTVLSFFGRDGERWQLNWFYRIGGVGVLVFGFLLVEQIITLG